MDLVDFGRYIGALLITLALLGVAALALRRLGPAFGLVVGPGLGGVGAAQAPRAVTLVQSLALDPRRRLVVVRFDGREHLILLGAAGETLVAAGSVGLVSAPETEAQL